ncbi:MAG: flagellar hook-associated protein FlgK [Deltaproteobacteria bacterium]|nr:flagellar hook-associated protein FlgK [Deltaproteobacteria bacterium]
MSLMNLLNIGKSAIIASQAGLNVTSHNIANANTEGYTRQEAILEIASPMSLSAGYIGRGVRVDSVVQRYDRFVEGQLLSQEQSLGKSTAMEEVLGQVEQVFNDQAGAGLSKELNAFFNSWQSLASDPSSSSQRTVLLAEAESLASNMRQMEENLLDTIGEVEVEIADVAARVNRIAEQIARYNVQIVQVEAGGTSTANDLRDARRALLTELGGLVGIDTREDATGALTITVGMRNLVDRDRVNPLTAVADASGSPGISIDGTDVTSRIDKGRLGGLLASRNAVRTEMLTDLRRLAAALTVEVNEIHSAGYGLDGSTGNDFFSPLVLSTTDASTGADVASATITDPTALTLSEYVVAIGAGGSYTVSTRDGGSVVATGTFSSGDPIAFEGITVVLTGTVAEGDSFTVSPLTRAASGFSVSMTDPSGIAAASAAASLPGDNTNALGIAALAGSATSSLGGATFSGYYGGLVSKAGSLSADATDLMSFDENLRSELANRRDAASGVSIDEEAIRLIQYQRMFEAGARMISITDELMQTVLAL